MTHVWHATRQKSPKSHCYEAPWIFIHKREHTWGSQWQDYVGEPLHLSLMWLWTLDDEHASHVQSSGRARRRELGVEECITIVQYGAGSFPGANANPCLAYISNNPTFDPAASSDSTTCSCSPPDAWCTDYLCLWTLQKRRASFCSSHSTESAADCEDREQDLISYKPI